MSHRNLAMFSALATMLAASLAAQTPAKSAPAPKTKSSGAVPRTPDGHPDLQGVWTNATITPMERPSSLGGKATFTDAEAKAAEKKSLDELNAQDGQSDGPLIAAAGSSGTGGYNVLFVDRGTQFAV